MRSSLLLLCLVVILACTNTQSNVLVPYQDYQIENSKMVSILKCVDDSEQLLDIDSLKNTSFRCSFEEYKKRAQQADYNSYLLKDATYAEVIPIMGRDFPIPDAIFTSKTAPARRVSIKWARRFIKIFQQKSTFKETLSMSCFEPHLALVIYKDEHQPIGYLVLCQSCLRLSAGGAISKTIGTKYNSYSPLASQQIEKLLKQVNVSYLSKW